MNRIIVFTEWLYELLKLHFFWILYVLRGFIVIGLFPATAAVYGVIRQWLIKAEPEDIKKLYKRLYKENFRIANILGWLFTVVSVIIFFNFLFIPNYPDALRVVMYAIVIFLAILILLAWLYLFPVIVHYQLNVRDYIRVILRVAVESVPSILVQLMILAIYAGIVNYLPALLVLLGVTPFAIAQMAISYNMLNRIERKEK